MHPKLFHLWGPFTLYSYGACMAAGVTAGFLAWFLRVRRLGGDQERLFALFLVMVASGLVGSWLLFIAANRELFAGLPWGEVALFGTRIPLPPLAEYFGGGMVYYGGAIGGVAGLVVYAAAARLPIVESLDCAAPALAIAHAWGRLGCFLAGCCWGRPCDGAAAPCVSFPPGSVAWSDMVDSGTLSASSASTPPLVPVQAIESLFELALALFLAWLYGARRRRGQVAGAYFLLYGAARFCIELLRADPYRGGMLLLSTSQLVSLAAVAAGTLLMTLKIRWKGFEA